jgi:thiol:disulfide interchange protein DsbC
MHRDSDARGTKRRRMRRAAVALASCGALLSALADDAPVLTKEQIVARYPEIPSGNVSDSPIGALYEVNVAGAISYVTTDGRFLIRGEIIDLASHENLTERRRAEQRADLIRSIDPSSAIVFKPENGIVLHRITVFTDVDCGYCRQLHRGIASMNALGIEVHYVAYPRTGPNTESWTKAEHVWCASDRNAALTKAKLGGDVPATEGCTAPVADHYELGRRIGMTGTPGVYAEDGTELGGYVPPAPLLELLEKRAAAR